MYAQPFLFRIRMLFLIRGPDIRWAFTGPLVLWFLVRFGLLSGPILGRLSICSLCILTICNFSYFAFWFLGLCLGSDCLSFWSLPIFYFYLYTYKVLTVDQIIESRGLNYVSSMLWIIIRESPRHGIFINTHNKGQMEKLSFLSF